MAAKTICPISREQFTKDAKTMEVVINGITMSLPAKQFSTG